ncbi:hypothetical protein [Azospirillum cavernae]|uniref:hypothetical protein n=1 Tax=Azospirillum cavernae TaxID=2320860 RepID=UPI0011C3665F|nr:hypothetical protein [Azospirillum cavernae]
MNLIWVRFLFRPAISRVAPGGTILAVKARWLAHNDLLFLDDFAFWTNSWMLAFVATAEMEQRHARQHTDHQD